MSNFGVIVNNLTDIIHYYNLMSTDETYTDELQLKLQFKW